MAIEMNKKKPELHEAWSDFKKELSKEIEPYLEKIAILAEKLINKIFKK